MREEIEKKLLLKAIFLLLNLRKDMIIKKVDIQPITGEIISEALYMKEKQEREDLVPLFINYLFKRYSLRLSNLLSISIECFSFCKASSKTEGTGISLPIASFIVSPNFAG